MWCGFIRLGFKSLLLYWIVDIANSKKSPWEEKMITLDIDLDVGSGCGYSYNCHVIYIIFSSFQHFLALQD